MKRVLGLDLGSASIGWAVIEENTSEVTSESTDNAKASAATAAPRTAPPA